MQAKPVVSGHEISPATRVPTVGNGERTFGPIHEATINSIRGTVIIAALRGHCL
jgi:hypothetical protein